MELLERLLERPVSAFRPSVEQAMPIFHQLGPGPSTRLLLLALESAAPKKAL